MRTTGESRELVQELLTSAEYRVVVQAHDDEQALEDLLSLIEGLTLRATQLRRSVAAERQVALFEAFPRALRVR